jgi:hypothetical protein
LEERISYRVGSFQARFRGLPLDRCLMRLWALLLASWFVAGSAVAGSVLFQATGLFNAGLSATFALDFVGGSAAANQVSASSFTTDGALSEGMHSGDVSGSLGSGLQLRDTTAFTEVLLDLSGASFFGFLFDPTALAPSNGDFGDSFSVFLLGADGASLLETDDPTGNHALLL